MLISASKYPPLGFFTSLQIDNPVSWEGFCWIEQKLGREGCWVSEQQGADSERVVDPRSEKWLLDASLPGPDVTCSQITLRWGTKTQWKAEGWGGGLPSHPLPVCSAVAPGKCRSLCVWKCVRWTRGGWRGGGERRSVSTPSCITGWRTGGSSSWLNFLLHLCLSHPDRRGSAERCALLGWMQTRWKGARWGGDTGLSSSPPPPTPPHLPPSLWSGVCVCISVCHVWVRVKQVGGPSADREAPRDEAALSRLRYVTDFSSLHHSQPDLPQQQSARVGRWDEGRLWLISRWIVSYPCVFMW